jgi:Trypsin-like peptidase domain
VDIRFKNYDITVDFVLSSDSFSVCDKEHDFAILKFPKERFTMERLPISLMGINYTMHVHAFGYIGHSGQFCVSDGQISVVEAASFGMTFLSAPGYSGAAVVSDGLGRVVGYLYGNVDSSNAINSQHQSLAFKIDRVAEITRRRESPQSSPGKSEMSSSSSASDEVQSTKRFKSNT